MPHKITMHLPRRVIESEIMRQHPSFPNLKQICLISITDPGSPICGNPADYKSILRLSFHDMTKPLLAFDEETQKELCTGYIFPSPEHARQIADFIREHKQDSIIAHCEAGISRSAAVACFLHMLGWEYVQIGPYGYQRANQMLLRFLVDEDTRNPILNLS